MDREGWATTRERRGWIETTLRGIAAGREGLRTGPFGKELRASEYTEEGVPVVNPRDLVDGSIDTTKVARIPPAKAAELGRYRLRPGDLLIARRGEVGRCALIDAAQEGWVCGTGCLRLRLGPGVEPAYLVQFLRWRATVRWLNDHAVGQTMANLSARIAAKLPVILPPPVEQRRIAAVLAGVDQARRGVERVIEQRRRVRRGVLGRLLTRGVGDPGTPSHRPKSTPIGELPSSWQVRPIGELCDFVNGQRFRTAEWSDAGLPIIRIQNLNGSREFKYFAGYAKPEWQVAPGELLFAWAGMRGVSFGPCLWNGPHGVLNQHIFRIRPKQGVSKAWLYELLREVTHQLERKAHGFKDSLLHLRKADVTGHLVPVPPYDEQRAIARYAADIDAATALDERALERLEALRRGLTNDLFTGRVPTRRELPIPAYRPADSAQLGLVPPPW
jgi:type I restriction enzyme S subunit